MNNKLHPQAQEEIPFIITKSWLSQYFERSFSWVRTHLLTDEVITEELGFDLNAFKNWQSFPPMAGERLKEWLKDKKLIKPIPTQTNRK